MKRLCNQKSIIIKMSAVFPFFLNFGFTKFLNNFWRKKPNKFFFFINQKKKKLYIGIVGEMCFWCLETSDWWLVTDDSCLLWAACCLPPFVCCLVPGVWCLLSSVSCVMFGDWCLASGFWCLRFPKTRALREMHPKWGYKPIKMQA